MGIINKLTILVLWKVLVKAEIRIENVWLKLSWYQTFRILGRFEFKIWAMKKIKKHFTKYLKGSNLLKTVKSIHYISFLITLQDDFHCGTIYDPSSNVQNEVDSLYDLWTLIRPIKIQYEIVHTKLKISIFSIEYGNIL